METNTNETLPNQTFNCFVPQTPKVCPTCKTCPTCGRKDYVWTTYPDWTAYWPHNTYYYPQTTNTTCSATNH